VASYVKVVKTLSNPYYCPSLVVFMWSC